MTVQARLGTAAALAVLLPLTGAAACRDDERPALPRLVIAAGQPGHVHYAVGQAYAEAVRRRWSMPAEVVATAGAVESLRMVAEGKADIGFAAVDVVENAMQGDAPFTGALPIDALARLYDDYLQVVVRAGGEIAQLGDLRGLRVSTGPAGSGTDIVASRILEAAGLGLHRIERRELSPTDAAAALRAGQIDALILTGGLPTPAVADLAGRVQIRVLSVPEEVGELERDYGESYLARSIPAGTYGLRDEVATLGIPNVLAVRRGMAEPTAFRLTELLFTERARLVAAHEEARRLDRRSAPATFPVPLHPGAARYYRQAKPMAYTRCEVMVRTG